MPRSDCPKCKGSGVRQRLVSEGRYAQGPCECLVEEEKVAAASVPTLASLDARLAAVEHRLKLLDEMRAKEKPAEVCTACKGAGYIVLDGESFACPKCGAAVKS